MQTPHIIKLSFLLTCLFILECCTKKRAPNFYEQTNFNNILNYRGVPDSVDDRSVYMFSDQGAWFGYSLPDTTDSQYNGSFIGPFLMTQDNGVWLSKALSKLEIEADGKLLDLSNEPSPSIVANKGVLGQLIVLEQINLEIETRLIFPSNRSALIQLVIKNPDRKKSIAVKAKLRGELMLENCNFAKNNENISINFDHNKTKGLIRFSGNTSTSIHKNGRLYETELFNQQLKAGESVTNQHTHSFYFTDDELDKEKEKSEQFLALNDSHFKVNKIRWEGKSRSILVRLKQSYRSPSHQRVAMKCLETLNNNWRSPAGFLKHDGLFPSYNYEWFNGFWSWDSWKHAVAIAKYDFKLAEEQIRAMYHFQNDIGMIADCVYRDTVIENHNWRDTKPPLSAWAVWEVYERSTQGNAVAYKDSSFLRELFPKIEKYHNWWYANRDHDQNGLCEYGSTDGSLIAAKWESGMDNAVRFDQTKIVQNNERAWSMNRESVDLNSYLFSEKNYLALITEQLGLPEKSKQYKKEAAALKEKIQTVFYDETSGWFFDIDLETKEHLKTFGSEGWIPLWTKAASKKQAARVRNILVDTSKFASYIPFPTLAADHPNFKPDGGYWRGPVWLDQAYFAVKGLENYGYTDDAQTFTNQLLNRLEGLKDSDAPIRENYHPLTGEGLESNHFSWSAAHILMLLTY